MSVADTHLPGLEPYTIRQHISGFGWWGCRGEYRKGDPDCIVATCKTLEGAVLVCNSLNVAA